MIRLFRYGDYNPLSGRKAMVTEMQTEFKVLNLGHVKYINHMGQEEDIIRAARQSTDGDFKGWGNDENKGDEKLLEYLYKNKHTTPFEMLELCVEIKCPIFVTREIHRHRTFSYNEMSARYIRMPNEHYIPKPRIQDTKNKQGSLMLQGQQDGWFERNVIQQQEQIYKHYEESLEQNIAKEVARINTPVSRYTKFWMKGNLRNWLHFLELRMAKNAQWEIRQYANVIGEMISKLWPRTYSLFFEHTFYAITLSREERNDLVNYIKADFYSVVNEHPELEDRFNKVYNKLIEENGERK